MAGRYCASSLRPKSDKLQRLEPPEQFLISSNPYPLEKIAECVQMERCYDFLQSSTYVEAGADLADAAGAEGGEFGADGVGFATGGECSLNP